MNLTRSYAIFLRQVYLLASNYSRWMVMFFWATADLLVWGLMTKYLHSISGSNFNFITVLIGSVIFAHFIGHSQGGLTIAQLEDVWSRNLINFFVTPLKIGEYLFGLTLTSMLTTTISLLWMVLLAWFLFSYNIFQFGFLLLPFIFTLFLFGMALGMVGISIVIRFGPSAEMFAWVIPTAFGPFSGIFYPIKTLPLFLQWVAKLIPSSYIFEGMRSVMLNGTFSYSQLIPGFFLAVVYFIGGYLMLGYYFRQALKRGLFIRFLTDTWL